ncbi:hypothetical protein TYRP_007464 [Tyrophagus putrescentiae]|nr:hypothetical protein TYRP_007464 [Tyrophagus putrescentiae]
MARSRSSSSSSCRQLAGCRANHISWRGRGPRQYLRSVAIVSSGAMACQPAPTIITSPRQHMTCPKPKNGHYHNAAGEWHTE